MYTLNTANVGPPHPDSQNNPYIRAFSPAMEDSYFRLLSPRIWVQKYMFAYPFSTTHFFFTL